MKPDKGLAWAQGLKMLGGLIDQLSPEAKRRRKAEELDLYLKRAEAEHKINYLLPYQRKMYESLTPGSKYVKYVNGMPVPLNAYERSRVDRAEIDTARARANAAADRGEGGYSIDTSGVDTPLPKAQPQLPIEVPPNPIDDSSTDIFKQGSAPPNVGSVDTTPEELYTFPSLHNIDWSIPS